MTRSRSAAVAVALCSVVAACSSGDDDLGEAQGSTISAPEVTTSVAAPATTTPAPATTSTTTAPPADPGATASTPQGQAAVDAVDRWIELEDQAFAAGTTESVDELDALMKDGSVTVRGSLTLGGPVERTGRARIDRIWHPEDGVTGLDVCKIIETPQGEARTAHTITATDGATPFLENETVYILERDGITCPPDDIIEPVLATYERWMGLFSAALADPANPAAELYERSSENLRQELDDTLADLRSDRLTERLNWTPNATVRSFSPSARVAEIVACREVAEDEGVFDADGVLVSGEDIGHVDQLTVRTGHMDDDWLVADYFFAEEAGWCAERLP